MKCTATTFVYPYVKSGDDFELHCSILSILKNFDGEVNFVIIGDKPSFKDIDFMFIESERKPMRALDIAHKLQTIINDLRIPENFVWIYDDVYFINPVKLEDLKQVYALQDLTGKDPESLKFDASKRWADMFKSTIAILIKENKPVINYETHLPRFLNKKKLQSTIRKYDLINSRVLFSTLYFAGTKNPTFLKPKMDNIKLGLYIAFTDVNKLHKKIKDNKFLNYSEVAYTQAMKELLTDLFVK